MNKVFDDLKKYVQNEVRNSPNSISTVNECINDELFTDYQKRNMVIGRQYIVMCGGIVFFEDENEYIKFFIDPSLVYSFNVTYSYFVAIELSIKLSMTFPDKINFNREFSEGTITTSSFEEVLFFFSVFSEELEKLQVNSGRAEDIFDFSSHNYFKNMKQSVINLEYLKNVKGWSSLHNKMLVYIDSYEGKPTLLTQCGQVYFNDKPYLVDVEVPVKKIVIKDFASHSNPHELEYIDKRFSSEGVTIKGNDLVIYPYSWYTAKGFRNYGLKQNEKLVAHSARYRRECSKSSSASSATRLIEENGVKFHYFWSLHIEDKEVE